VDGSTASDRLGGCSWIICLSSAHYERGRSARLNTLAGRNLRELMPNDGLGCEGRPMTNATGVPVAAPRVATLRGPRGTAQHCVAATQGREQLAAVPDRHRGGAGRDELSRRPRLDARQMIFVRC
jgi:hypothetical protein